MQIVAFNGPRLFQYEDRMELLKKEINKRPAFKFINDINHVSIEKQIRWVFDDNYRNIVYTSP